MKSIGIKNLYFQKNFNNINSLFTYIYKCNYVVIVGSDEIKKACLNKSNPSEINILSENIPLIQTILDVIIDKSYTYVIINNKAIQIRFINFSNSNLEKLILKKKSYNGYFWVV